MNYPILQKNVDELESLFRFNFTEQDDDQVRRQRFKASERKIERTLNFGRSYIAAESNAHPSDHHLSLLISRFNNIDSEFSRLKKDIMADDVGRRLHFLDASSPSSGVVEEVRDDTIRAVDGGENGRVLTSTTTLDEELIRAVPPEEGVEERKDNCDTVGRKWWCYWRPVVLRVAAVSVVVASVLLSNGVWCHIIHSAGKSYVLPHPT